MWYPFQGMGKPHAANRACLVISDVLHMTAAKLLARLVWDEIERGAKVALLPPSEPTLFCLIVHCTLHFSMIFAVKTGPRPVCWCSQVDAIVICEDATNRPPTEDDSLALISSQSTLLMTPPSRERRAVCVPDDQQRAKVGASEQATCCRS